MSVYCDTMDGPMVTATELDLEMENVNYVLPDIKNTKQNLRTHLTEKLLLESLGVCS